MELTISLQPKQRRFLETIEQTPITFYGGAKGGGKSKGLQLIMLLRRFKYPGSTGAIFRRTYPELEGNHIRPLFAAFPSLREYWHESKKLLTLPNGSTLQFCHANNEADIDLYQGREFHDLAIDEAGQWTEAMFRKLLGSNRSSKSGVAARALLTGNPGGIGHGWLKRIFVEKRFNERERPQDYSFIQALVDDNAALMENDPDYVSRLDSEPNEALRKAYRFGDWDIFAGQFFQELSRDIHLIKPFPIPAHWTRSGCYDFGFNHPGTFGWWANDEDGNTYLYREKVTAGWRVDQWAEYVNRFDDSKLLYPIIAGHDCWAKKHAMINKNQAAPPTIAEEFQNHGLILKPAVIDRVAGAAQLRSYLAWKDRPNNKPRLFIFNTCPVTYECLARMIHDPDKAEDVLKVDAVEGDPLTGDDPYDMTRYHVMSRPIITDALINKAPVGSKDWYQKQADDIWEREREALINQENGSNFPHDDSGWGNL